MITINEITTNRFSLNGIEYFKNFTPVVRGDYITIVNTYDARIVLSQPVIYSDFTIDGNTYANVELTQSALLDVIFTRSTLGSGGTGVWGSITGNIENQTDLINLINAGGTDQPVQQTYADITALLADQGNQTTGFLQKVTDASADPEVTSGIAYYEKLAASTASLDDYDRLTNEQAAALEQTPENRFTVDVITDSAPTDVDPLKVKIEYDNGDDSVKGILFPAVYSLYLAGMNSLDTAIADFSFSLYNKTKNKWYGGVAVDFTLVNTVFYKVNFGNATVDRTEFDVGDIVEVHFNAYKVGTSSGGDDQRQRAVISIAAANEPPPSNNDGDRYIIDFTVGTKHPSWGDCEKGEIVQNVEGVTWDCVTPVEGMVAYVDDENKDAIYVDDGTPAWELRDSDNSALQYQTEITTNTTLDGTQKGLNKVYPVNSTSATQITITTGDYVENDVINIERRGQGTVEIVADTGVRIRGVRDIDNKYFINDANSMVSLLCRGGEVFTIIGRLKNGYTGAPTVSSYSELQEGQTGVELTITGTGFSENMLYSFSSGITVNSRVSVTTSKLVLNVDVTGSAGDDITATFDNGDVFVDTDAITIQDLIYTTITSLDTLEHDTANGQYNSLVQIDSTHFILAYNGNGNDGFIKTFSVDGSGNITEIDSLEHDTVLANFNSLIKIDSTHYALAYTSVGNNGFIKTFEIDGSYNITQLDSLEHEPTTFASNNSLTLIDSTHLALAYAGDGGDGYIKTFELDGGFNITELDVLEHDTLNGINNSLVKIDSTHLILAYTGDGTDGYIKTFELDGGFNITELDVLEHEPTLCNNNSLVQIDSTHFILAYNGNGNDGFIKTFEIDGSYNITQLDSLEHNIWLGADNSLCKINAKNYILGTNAQEDGVDIGLMLVLFEVDESFNIVETTELFADDDAASTVYTSLGVLNSSQVAVAYAGLDNDGYIKTFEIS